MNKSFFCLLIVSLCFDLALCVASNKVFISDVVFSISDSADSLNEGTKYNCEHPKTLDNIDVDGHHHIQLKFKLKGQTNKAIEPQQVFLQLVSPQTKFEYISLAKKDGKGQYTVHIPLSKTASSLGGKSGIYDFNLIIGDSSISNPINWKIGTLNVKFKAGEIKIEDPFAKKLDISHKFREPEKRPDKIISFAFTLAVLAPFVVLFAGFAMVGINFGDFPSGQNSMYAYGFHFVLGAILALYAIYWYELNMMQTLGYLAVLLGPFLFFAHKTLNHLAQERSKVN